MNSLELTRHLYKSGFISKEAAVGILKRRDGLIKKAMEKYADEMFKEAQAGKVIKGDPLFKKTLMNLLPIAGLAGIAAAGSTAAKFIASSAADAKLKNEVGRSYSQVFDQYPELKEDKDEATKHFNVMAKFAPALAANPLVAGTFIKGTMNMGHIGPETVRMLIEAQRSWEDIRERRSPVAGFVSALPPTHKMIEPSLAFEAVTK